MFELTVIDEVVSPKKQKIDWSINDLNRHDRRAQMAKARKKPSKKGKKKK